MADLTCVNHGSIILLRGETPAGQEWLRERIDADAQTWCGAIAVEPRYVGAIIEGALNDGLEVAHD